MIQIKTFEKVDGGAKGVCDLKDGLSPYPTQLINKLSVHTSHLAKASTQTTSGLFDHVQR